MRTHQPLWMIYYNSIYFIYFFFFKFEIQFFGFVSIVWNRRSGGIECSDSDSNQRVLENSSIKWKSISKSIRCRTGRDGGLIGRPWTSTVAGCSSSICVSFVFFHHLLKTNSIVFCVFSLISNSSLWVTQPLPWLHLLLMMFPFRPNFILLPSSAFSIFFLSDGWKVSLEFFLDNTIYFVAWVRHSTLFINDSHLQNSWSCSSFSNTIKCLVARLAVLVAPYQVLENVEAQ